jgi:hypothetical protein
MLTREPRGATRRCRSKHRRVGVRDEFSDFACRISALREQVIVDGPAPHFYCATEIDGDIKIWKPQKATPREADVFDI